MELSRRRLAALVAAGTIGSSGCLGALTGDEALEFEATAAHVDEPVLAETGYELSATDREVVVESFEVLGQEREAEVTNVFAEYDRAVDLGLLGERRAARFGVFSTPKAEYLTRSFNPVGDMTNEELATELQSRYDELSVGEEVETETVTILDDEVTMSTFECVASMYGIDVDAYLHLGSTDHGDDYVVVLGAYPQLLDDEAENVFAMARAVRHEG